MNKTNRAAFDELASGLTENERNRLMVKLGIPARKLWPFKLEKPHNKAHEIARRKRQIECGMLKTS